MSSLPATIVAQVNGQGSGTVQEVSIPGKPYKIRTDVYKEAGGTDTAPAPVVYSLASLSSCTQAVGFMVAGSLGITLGEWQVAVEGKLPNPKLLSKEEFNPGFESVDLKLSVQTSIKGGNEAPEFKQFTAEVERMCPMTGLFRRAVPAFHVEWNNESL